MTQRDLIIAKCISLASQRLAIREIISFGLDTNQSDADFSELVNFFAPILDKNYLDLIDALRELRDASDQEVSSSEFSKILKKFM